MPAGYTYAAVKSAVNNPSILSKQAKEGYAINKFTPENKLEDAEIVDPKDLSSSQKQEINDFAIKLLNSVRTQAGVKAITTNEKVLKFANDVANEYQIHNKTDKVEYIDGLISAEKKQFKYSYEKRCRKFNSFKFTNL